jgi:hypothetical protein
MFKTIITLCSIMFSFSVAVAGSLDLPNVKPGDKWISKNITETGKDSWVEKHREFTVMRNTPDSILLSIKEVGSKLPPDEQLVGADWSMFKNINGQEVIVSRPFDFPLYQGKSWNIEYVEDHPNKNRKNQQIRLNYRVVGWEEIEVPAGKFNAMKIEAEGNWKAELESSVGATISTKASPSGSMAIMQAGKVPHKLLTGRLYKAFWYVPSVKRFVKIMEEDFNTQGARDRRFTSELESFKVSE